MCDHYSPEIGYTQNLQSVYSVNYIISAQVCESYNKPEMQADDTSLKGTKVIIIINLHFSSHMHNLVRKPWVKVYGCSTCKVISKNSLIES